jgi:peptidyl-prolyl cis-trans isomerase C
MRTILILAVLAVACGGEKQDAETKPAQPAKTAPRVEPNYVTVDHILIGVKGALPVDRTAEDARALTDEIVERLKAGEDWETLKQQYSDDRPVSGPARGPYPLANRGMNPGGAAPRENMVQGFGDVSFGLEVGEVGVAEYDPRKSKYGYHIIKRIK